MMVIHLLCLLPAIVGALDFIPMVRVTNAGNGGFNGHFIFNLTEDLVGWKIQIDFSKAVTGLTTTSPQFNVMVQGTMKDGNVPSAQAYLQNMGHDNFKPPIPSNTDGTKYNYDEVLMKSIMFYLAQRSGKLPADNPIPWREDSALNDRGQNGEDLTGGWYDAQEQARFGTTIAYSNVEQHIIKDVTNLLCRIAEKSDRLINNSTTNLAESWMHIRTKFDGGKVHNLCNRGSWHARCYGGALRMNLGPQWSCKVWESSIGTEPGHLFRKLYARHEQTLANSIKHKSKPNIQQVRWKKKMSCLKTSTSKKARKAYGPEAIDVTDDVSSDNLEKLKHDYLNLHIHLSELQRLNITNLTILQSQSGLWHTERKKRITASDFGSIVKRNPSLLTAKFIRTILYSTFTGNYHTRKGILEEETTIEEYKLKKAEESENVCVERSGLVIHPTQTFLAGSPDGLVSTSKGESGLIEIKNLLHSKPINLWEASENKNFCLINLNGKLQLKENHIYYYQCHGLINIYNRDWIDFVVRTLNPHQLFIQRIYRNIDFWENTMLPKLEAFYHKVLLPELASPREGKSPGIREPGIWYTPPLQSKQPRRKRSKSSTVNARSKKRVSESSSSSDSDIVDTELQRPAPLRNRRTRLRPTKFLAKLQFRQTGFWELGKTVDFFET
ncbi:unnamed protein product [Mytilus edulis]|uniref:cellulase n=1 Tax=Mytilus edulis TaxID=6550 RepID=A0A8S3UK25_MYTED|nr:unnamed protein product [Mytilus edulis]